MLTRVAAAAVLLLMLTWPGAAHAEVIECPPGSTPINGQCTITITDPGDGGSGGSDTGGDNENAGHEDQKCTSDGKEIPCNTDAGSWNGTCYVKVADPQPPKDDPVWDGHTDGVILDCTSDLGDTMLTRPIWAAGPPAGGPSPRQLADSAVAKMNFSAGDIGITPPTATGAMGVVGLPTWLWISNPGESTTGPITRTAAAGGVTVTATGRLDRIVWDMGNGRSVTCAGAGTPYSAGYDDKPSPTCGYTYTETSGNQPGKAYTITATSYWTVTWNGGGQSGTIPLNFSRSVQHKVGEIQVLITKHGK